MAFSHGKDFEVKLGTTGTPTVLVDLSAYFNSCSFPQEKETAEVTAFGASSKARIVGLRDASFSVEGFFDPTVDAHLAGVLAHTAADIDFDVTPQVGGPTYSGNCICTSYEVSGGVGDAVTFSAEFEMNGDVSRA